MLKRANKITVKVNGDGFIATFYKTHDVVAEISSEMTEWKAMEGVGSTANRELFRAYCIDNAPIFGVNWDPVDRRSELNKVPNKLNDENINEVVTDKAELYLMPIVSKIAEQVDVPMFVNKVWISEIIEKKLHNGREVSPRYKDGSYAYAELAVFAEVIVNVDRKSVVIPCHMEIVSGQLKKPTITMTMVKDFIASELAEIRLSQSKKNEDVKEEVSITQEQPKKRGRKSKKEA